VGNVAIVSGGQLPQHSELYFQDRYSGGPIWVDTLAEYLGQPAVQPSLKPDAGGLDYAFAGATLAYQNTAIPYGAFPRVSQQVATYLGGHTPHANDLFALWAGPNDQFFSLFQQGAAIDPSKPAAAMAAAVDTLINAGAREFVVPNLPPLGQTPFFLDLLKGGLISQGQVDQVNLWSAGFDLYLGAFLAQEQQAHPGVKLISVDVAGLFGQAAQAGNPFGFVNWTNAAGPYDALGNLTAITAADAGKYLFFDSVHPSTTSHQIIGLRAAAQVYAALGVREVDVTNTTDAVNPLDGGLSLREALNLANAMPGGEAVGFDLGVGLHEIKLGGQDLQLSGQVSVLGPGAELLSVDGQGASRIFEVTAAAHATVSGLTLRGGSADEGGAVANAGQLMLQGVVLTGNVALFGGAIYNSGILQLDADLLFFNTASGVDLAAGGALANDGPDAQAFVTDTVFLDNIAGDGARALGGAIANLNGASLSVSHSLLFGNSARAGDGGDGLGGGIYNGSGSVLVVEDSALVANYAIGPRGGRGFGGGLYEARGSNTTLRGTLLLGNFATTDGWDVYSEM
jgi:phospholipase/lecithinase/hemolysin